MFIYCEAGYGRKPHFPVSSCGGYSAKPARWMSKKPAASDEMDYVSYFFENKYVGREKPFHESS